MAFRNDIAASQARLESLEEENRRLAQELADERAQRPRPPPPSRLAFSVLVLIGSLMTLSIVAGAFAWVALRPLKQPAPHEEYVQVETVADTALPTPSQGLVVEDLRVGTGALARSGAELRVHYTGTLKDGKVFDSSYDRQEPFSFTLGRGQVIKGWEQGFTGMRVGGKRRLTLPPELGYGTRGAPPKIPANAQLVFEVELLGVK